MEKIFIMLNRKISYKLLDEDSFSLIPLVEIWALPILKMILI